MTVASPLAKLCVEAASQSIESIEKWRKQRRTLDRLPSPLSNALFRRLHQKCLLFPSLLEVFKNSVDAIDLSGDHNVDAEWLAYIGGFKCLQSLILSDCHRVNNSAIWPLIGLSELKEIDLSRCTKLSDPGIKYVLSIPTIEILRVSQTSLTAEGVSSLVSLKNLTVLELGGLPVTDNVLVSLQVLSKLEHLDLWGSEITDFGAIVLSTFPKLKSLNLALTNVSSLPTLKSIESINMSHCTITSLYSDSLTKLVLSGSSLSSNYDEFLDIETSFLTYLDVSSSSLSDFFIRSRLKAIQYLDLASTSVEDTSLRLIAEVGSNLKHLNLSKTKITSKGLAILVGRVPILQHLSLSQTLIDDAVIPYVSLMPSLKNLNLSRTQIRGYDAEKRRSLEGLKRMSELESLNLEDTKVREDGLRPLVAIQRLKRLFLRNESLTDYSLHLMAYNNELEHFGFCDAVVTDDGIGSFDPPKRLQTLNLSGCWLLSEAAILSFCGNHPTIKVVHEAFVGNNTLHKRVVKSNQVKSSKSPFVCPRFADQRVKYKREELLAEQFTSASTRLPPHVLQLFPDTG